MSEQTSNPTSGQNVPKSKFRRKSRQEQTAASKLRMERRGEKLDAAREKLAKQKPPKKPGAVKRLAHTAGHGVHGFVHGKLYEVEHENVGTEGAHRSELAAESVYRLGRRKLRKAIREHPAKAVERAESKHIKATADYYYRKTVEEHPEMQEGGAVSRYLQKQKIKRQYLSKAEGTQKSAYKVVDFAEVFRVQLATVSDLSEEKKQHLEVNIPDRLYCEVEQVQMERAIQNILVNAIRYSPSNESIHITLSEIHGTIRGEIENTGVHVPDDALPHLFEAFYRADASRNRNTGGTGLGLYIVRKIMEMHHAKYGITNTSNGVMFWFELPCKQPIDNSI